MADFIPHEDTLKIEFQSTWWSEGVADLIRMVISQLKLIPQATEWSDGVADLIPDEDKLKVISHST